MAFRRRRSFCSFRGRRGFVGRRSRVRGIRIGYRF